MEIERAYNPESRREAQIDLSSLSFTFCADEEIKRYYDEKLKETESYEGWLAMNKEKLSENKAKITKAIEDGLIPDEHPETIWKFEIDNSKKGQERAPQIKRELESRVEDIRKIVSEKLGNFLPDWILEKATITFALNEKADFCIDGNNITVDLGRLLFEKSPFEKTVQGITHEVFHIWMSEKTEWSDTKQNEASDQVLRDRIIFKTIDEGLAVLVSGQSLEEHHKKQGRNYKDYTQESFATFNNFTRVENRGELERIKNEEFQNMGHFYVVGNEIVRAILQEKGIEGFRKLIEDVRDNPAKLLEIYKAICVNNPELPKIE